MVRLSEPASLVLFHTRQMAKLVDLHPMYWPENHDSDSEEENDDVDIGPWPYEFGLSGEQWDEDLPVNIEPFFPPIESLYWHPPGPRVWGTYNKTPVASST